MKRACIVGILGLIGVAGSAPCESEIPTAPPDSSAMLTCPLSWQPNALAPVFYGERAYGPASGAPVPIRVYFPSQDPFSPAHAPILEGCGRYPVVLFAHGQCLQDPNHFEKWLHLPRQLARAGYVVVVPQLPMTYPPSAENHPALPIMSASLAWLRETWEHRDVLMPPPATGVAGHSYGALVGARYAKAHPVAAYAGVGGPWHEWATGLPNAPIVTLGGPKLLLWGTDESYSTIPDPYWNLLSAPKHRAAFARGVHFDYLPAGWSPCDLRRSACGHIPAATADLVTMLFGKYLPPELSPHLRSAVPFDLVPPPLVLTQEQQFYATGYLEGMRNMVGPDCGVTLTTVTGQERAVPDVLELSLSSADRIVRAAGLIPRFVGPSGPRSWVYSQSPQPGIVVQPGATVTLRLKNTPRP